MSAPAVPSPATGADGAELERLRSAFQDVLAAERRLRGREGRLGASVSIAQWRLLARLLDEHECTPSRLAEFAEVTPASVTGMLDLLEERGLVTRRRDPADRRSVRVALTEAGRATASERRATFLTLWEEAMEDLSPEQLSAAAEVLERLPAFFARVAERKAASPAP